MLQLHSRVDVLVLVLLQSDLEGVVLLSSHVQHNGLTLAQTALQALLPWWLLLILLLCVTVLHFVFFLQVVGGGGWTRRQLCVVPVSVVL